MGKNVDVEKELEQDAESVIGKGGKGTCTFRALKYPGTPRQASPNLLFAFWRYENAEFQI